MVNPSDIQQWIEAEIPDTQASVTGDGHHFEAQVISPAFAGKNTLARHRLVYEALGAKMGTTIHALSLKTLSPEEVN